MKKNITIIHTGGTIAMSTNAQTGAVDLGEQNPRFSTTSVFNPYANIEEKNFLNIPSPHITPHTMLQIATKIKSEVSKKGVDGIVLTHGTDVLEETAYLIDLLIQTDTPIVLTGAMRSSNEIGADGPLNLRQAVRVAASPQARGKGVLVVLHNEIHSARYVTKMHTTKVNAFQSPETGPIGAITTQSIRFYGTPTPQRGYPVDQLSKKVMLFKVFSGMDADWIHSLTEHHYDGVVLEAFGQGNVPPSFIPALRSLIDQQIPVVLVSRVLSGSVEGNYAYAGGGKELQRMGIMFAHHLTGPKARLKLMVALEYASDLDHVRTIISTES